MNQHRPGRNPHIGQPAEPLVLLRRQSAGFLLAVHASSCGSQDFWIPIKNLELYPDVAAAVEFRVLLKSRLNTTFAMGSGGAASTKGPLVLNLFNFLSQPVVGRRRR